MTLETFATAVCQQLGPDYEMAMQHPHCARFTYLPATLTFMLLLRGYGAKANKVMVSIWAPRMPDGTSMWIDEKVVIHISLTRDPRSAARDIERRFIAPWLPHWSEVVLRNQRLIMEVDRSQTLVGELADRLGTRPLTHYRAEYICRGNIRYPPSSDRGVWVEAQVVHGGEQVDFKITSVPAEIARQLVDWLKRHEKGCIRQSAGYNPNHDQDT